MAESFTGRLFKFVERYPHPHGTEVARILGAKTSVSTSGFPYISQGSFRLFLQEVPHLFRDGSDLLDWLTLLELEMANNQFSSREISSIQKGMFVVRNIIFSAGICAPPDLWILRHILSNHKKVGLISVFQDGGFLDRDDLADQFGLDRRHLGWDLSFLHCRGYLRCRGKRYSLAPNSAAGDVFHHASAISENLLRDIVEPIANVFQRKASSEELETVSQFYQYAERGAIAKSWNADYFQLEVGYRLVPTVLAIHLIKANAGAESGVDIKQRIPNLLPHTERLLSDAGVIRDGVLTALGARILSRGPGPYGIIHAYMPYMLELENKLRGRSIATHVQRAKNIAASQSANRKTFAMGNDNLDRFSKEQNFQYRVYIEHALGQGEATRQRLERNGEEVIQYFGADLEDAAIEAARQLQRKGVLPKNMIFISQADIANPDAVIQNVHGHGFETSGAVMFVGNGFHEIRGQTNAKIVDVFRAYCEAGLLLIFTEESALDDRDLLHTGWNTYHAGFRYVHELSGQGLRPAAGRDPDGRYSWKICASLGGYAVLQKYSAHTRTIYPYPRKGGYNPPISMTYFCVPESLARKLGFYPVSWTQTEPKGAKSAVIQDQ